MRIRHQAEQRPRSHNRPYGPRVRTADLPCPKITEHREQASHIFTPHPSQWSVLTRRIGISMQSLDKQFIVRVVKLGAPMDALVRLVVCDDLNCDEVFASCCCSSTVLLVEQRTVVVP